MIFPWLWRVLPGKTLLKVLQLVTLSVVLLLLLFGWAFPAIHSMLNPPPIVGAWG